MNKEFTSLNSLMKHYDIQVGGNSPNEEVDPHKYGAELANQAIERIARKRVESSSRKVRKRSKKT